MQDALAELLRRRKDRTLAVILGVKERECDQHLPPEVQRRLRKAVLDAVNDLYEVILDVMGSYDASGDVVLNEDYLRKIDDLHDALIRIPLRARTD
jgi:hypothetical protein